MWSEAHKFKTYTFKGALSSVTAVATAQGKVFGACADGSILMWKEPYNLLKLRTILHQNPSLKWGTPHGSSCIKKGNSRASIRSTTSRTTVLVEELPTSIVEQIGTKEKSNKSKNSDERKRIIELGLDESENDAYGASFSANNNNNNNNNHNMFVNSNNIELRQSNDLSLDFPSAPSSFVPSVAPELIAQQFSQFYSQNQLPVVDPHESVQQLQQKHLLELQQLQQQHQLEIQQFQLQQQMLIDQFQHQNPPNYQQQQLFIIQQQTLQQQLLQQQQQQQQLLQQKQGQELQQQNASRTIESHQDLNQLQPQQLLQFIQQQQLQQQQLQQQLQASQYQSQLNPQMQSQLNPQLQSQLNLSSVQGNSQFQSQLNPQLQSQLNLSSLQGNSQISQNLGQFQQTPQLPQMNQFNPQFQSQINPQFASHLQTPNIQSQAQPQIKQSQSTSQPTPKRQPEENPACVVCLETPKNSLLYPCGHACVCNDCGKELITRKLKCPLCRAPVKDCVKVFK